MDVKPWEPVTVQYVDLSDGWKGMNWPFAEDDYDTLSGPAMKEWSGNVTLANGQRIIVHALSEDRKAARAAMKEAPK